MFSQLAVVHRKKPALFDPLPAEWRVFVTCLRSLAISFSPDSLPELESGDQLFRGDEAYRFLLEVACGLQSPVVGETEVFGQFRRFAEDWAERSVFFQSVFSDVKIVRQQHLSHLGSHSYGSWVRRQVGEGELIHVVGSGQLAEEIQIWLGKQNQVCFYSRSPGLAAQRLRQTALSGSVEIRGLASKPVLDGAVVVVAAPLSASLIHKWMGAEIPRLVIDLRDVSSSDRIDVKCRCFRLSDIFVEIDAGRVLAREKIQQARRSIDAIVTKRFQSQRIRPFGWDDICA